MQPDPTEEDIGRLTDAFRRGERPVVLPPGRCGGQMTDASGSPKPVQWRHMPAVVLARRETPAPLLRKDLPVFVDEDALTPDTAPRPAACRRCREREDDGVGTLARVLDRAADRIGLSPSVLVAMLSDDTLARLYVTCRSFGGPE